MKVEIKFMKRILLLCIAVWAGGMLLLAFGWRSIDSPTDFANTRWVSQNPDMFFEVGPFRLVTCAQIIINGKVSEMNIRIEGGMGGRGIDFHVLGTNEVQRHNSLLLLSGNRRWREGNLVIIRRSDCTGIIDASITEIIFVKEDLEGV